MGDKVGRIVSLEGREDRNVGIKDGLPLRFAVGFEEVLTVGLVVGNAEGGMVNILVVGRAVGD